jgi:uncharacterized protein (DUF58 family)
MIKKRRFMEAFPMPTVRTVWLSALGMVAAIIWGWKGILGFDLAILALCCIDFVMLLRGEKIEVRRHSPSHFSLGDCHDIEILLENRGARDIAVQVRDQTPTEWAAPPVLKGRVAARSALRLKYQVTPHSRGVYTFGDLSVRVEGPMGLMLGTERFGTAEKINVYPSFRPIRYPDLATYRRRSRQWGLRKAMWRGEGREFESLREYMEGDDPRKIHWKASARLDYPIVQEFQPEKNQIVMILLDAGRLMGAFSEGKNKLDHALEAAVQLVQTALSGGDQAGVLAFSDRVISFIPPKRTPQQLQTIMEGTLPLQPTLVEPQYEQAFLWLQAHISRRSLVVIFTDLLDESASENLLSAVALLRPRHLPMCVTIRASEWDDLTKVMPSSVDEIYERSALQESLHQRRMALKRLVQQGALAMDLPPGKLSLSTMERYLEVKQRGLL